MGKPQMDGRESGCQNNASSGWRRKCRSARTRGDTILRTLGKHSVTFSKNSKKGRKDGSPLICRHNIEKKFGSLLEVRTGGTTPHKERGRQARKEDLAAAASHYHAKTEWGRAEHTKALSINFGLLATHRALPGTRRRAETTAWGRGTRCGRRDGSAHRPRAGGSPLAAPSPPCAPPQMRRRQGFSSGS